MHKYKEKQLLRISLFKKQKVRRISKLYKMNFYRISKYKLCTILDEKYRFKDIPRLKYFERKIK